MEAAALAKALKGDVAVQRLVGGGYLLLLKTEKSHEAWAASEGQRGKRARGVPSRPAWPHRREGTALSPSGGG